MSFKSNRSSNLRRRELEEIWRRRLESALERYRAAADECGKLLQEEPSGGPADDLVLKAEADALSRVLRIFTDLVMDGKLPEEADEAIGSAGGAPTHKISVVDEDESIRDSAETFPAVSRLPGGDIRLS